MDSSVELVVRMICATLAGAMLGFERDVHSRPAGLRTHALVSTGSALFTLAGAYGFDRADEVLDPTRIAAQVVSGLGFIGAGTILHDRGGVRGLTTAATIWTSGAMGVAYAAGAYVVATAALILSLLVLLALKPVRNLSSRIGRSYVSLNFEYETGFGTMGPILSGLGQAGLKPEVLLIEDDHADHVGASPGSLRRLHIEVLGRPLQLASLDDLVADLKERPEVRVAALDRERPD